MRLKIEIPQLDFAFDAEGRDEVVQEQYRRAFALATEMRQAREMATHLDSRAKHLSRAKSKPIKWKPGPRYTLPGHVFGDGGGI